ncbi:hypothetical protein DZC78_02670 [Olleya aquimaris]|nr:hypothetical protein DZC78_02670 [Olleya aquimaris]
MSKYLEYKIINYPRVIDNNIVQPQKGAIITTANDEFFIESHTGSFAVYIAMGLLFFLIGFFGYYYHGNGDINFLDLIFMIPGLFLILLGVFKPKRYMQLHFDRQKGIISYPAPFFGKPLVGPFNSLKALIGVSGDIDGYSPTEYLKFVNTFRPRILDVLKTITYEDPYKEWSLYVWYMDKNRPLPSGTAFDTYRQQDFERRKAEGFPKPLYESNIPTPEATEEQQAERERIGGW